MRSICAFLLLPAISLALNPQIAENTTVNITLRPSGNYDLTADTALAIKNPSAEYDLLGGVLNYTLPYGLSAIETGPSFLEENVSHFSYVDKKITFHFVRRSSEEKIYYKTFGNSLNGTEVLPLSLREYMQPDPNDGFVWAGDVVDYSIEIKNLMGRNITVSALEKEFPGAEIRYALANSTTAQNPPEIYAAAGKVAWRGFILLENETAVVRVGAVFKAAPQTLPKTRVVLLFPPRPLENSPAVEKVISENVVSLEKGQSGDGKWRVALTYYNPTPFVQELRALKITKTNAPDTNIGNAVPVWSMGNASILVNGGQELNYSFLDNSTQTPMYWLSAKQGTVTELKKEVVVNIIYEEGKNIPALQARPAAPPASQPSSGAQAPAEPQKETIAAEKPLVEVAKKVEKNRIRVEEPFVVSVSIKNPNKGDAKEITLSEYLPEGFDTPAGAFIRVNNSLVWKIPVISGGSTTWMNYTLTPRKTGIYSLPPAVVSIKGAAERIFSNYLIVNVVKNGTAMEEGAHPAENTTAPEVMVLKTITKTDYGYFVRIKVINLKQEAARSLTLTDPLAKGQPVSEIMPFTVPAKNSIEWLVESLPAGGSLEFAYKVLAKETAATMPYVGGIPDGRAAVSISFSPQFAEGMTSRSMEAAAIVLLAALLAAGLVKRRTVKSRIRELKDMAAQADAALKRGDVKKAVKLYKAAQEEYDGLVSGPGTKDAETAKALNEIYGSIRRTYEKLNKK